MSRHRRNSIETGTIGWISIADVFLLLTILMLALALGLSGAGRRLTVSARADHDRAEKGDYLIKALTHQHELDAEELGQLNRLKEQLAALSSQAIAAGANLSRAEQDAKLWKDLADNLKLKVLGAERQASAANDSARDTSSRLAAALAQAAAFKEKLDSNTKRVEIAESQAAEIQAKLDALRLKLADVETRRDAAESHAMAWKARFDAGIGAENKVRKQLIGLSGELGRVVFVFDKSGSMSSGGRWDFVKETAGIWLTQLPVKEASLIVFSDSAVCYPADERTMRDMTVEAQRTELLAKLQENQPGGWTNTYEALEKAFRYERIDAIVLFTDGQPTIGPMKRGNFKTESEARMAAIIDLVSRKQMELGHKVPIHTIALGDYFGENFGPFLQNLSRDVTGGTFIGR
jgi:hypothetical protein